MMMLERDEVREASANWVFSTVFNWANSSGEYWTPTLANRLSHIRTYSSIRLGTAGTVICPIATDRRYNRRAIASRSVDGLKDLTAESSTRLFYTTPTPLHQRSML